MRPLMTCAVATVILSFVGMHYPEAGRPPAQIPLRIEFANQASDRMHGDGGAYEHGVSSVVAYIDRSNNSALVFGTDTSGTGGRTIGFSFEDCLLAPPESCGAPFESGFAPAGILAAPRNAAGAAVTGGLLGMAVGQTLRAFFQIQVNGQADQWTLCMKPENTGFCANSQSGVYGRVTRLAPDAWEFFAADIADDWGARSDVADLLRTSGSGKKKVISLEGTYSLPFRFTATCVNATACS